MAGGKLPPRQKMIGMMYLVLTALLAMNVSKDILNAFVTVNSGLENTKNTFKGKNEDQYTRFSNQYAENKEKFGDGWAKAQKVQKLADELVTYIDDIKVKIIAGVQPEYTEETARGKNQFGIDTILDLKYVKVKDNYLIPTQILVGSEPANPKTDEYSAMDLISKLIVFKNELKTFVPKDSPIQISLEETYKFEERRAAGGNMENWPSWNFYGVPCAATITLLTKMQTDVRAFESDVVKYLFGSADELTYKFTGLAPAIIPNSNYVIAGDTFSAKVFLAAFDTTMSPEILLGEGYDSTTKKITGEEIPINVVKGNGYIKIPTRSQGLFSYKGVINFKGPKGMEQYPYSIDYQVAAPSTTISATAMNVFYIGVPNPVDISASGVPKDKISASVSGGSISKAKDGWVVNVKTPGKAVVSVSAEIDGNRQKMGSMEFRVKRIPTPIAEIGGKSSGAIPRGKLAGTSGIIAQMENFEFDVRVVVSSFKFVYTQANGLSKEIPVKGPKFSDQVRGILRQIKPGSRVTFEDIKATMPDGEQRKLGSIVLKAV